MQVLKAGEQRWEQTEARSSGNYRPKYGKKAQEEKKNIRKREEEKETERKQARRRRLCLCPAWQSCELCDLLPPLQSGATLSMTADWEGAGCLWLDPRSSSPLSHSQSAALTAAQSHAVTVLQTGRGEQGQETLLAPPEKEGIINLPVSQSSSSNFVPWNSAATGRIDLVKKQG
ncbi:UNVERIFIED_CONTAM: hypothetical protein FKN15_076247 [Acipenser sinensis]